MPLKLNPRKAFLNRCDRLKGVDIHPTEPWVMANLYNGSLHIWNYNDGSLVRSFEVCDFPVRAAKFVARKQWILCGADDMRLRVYNYDTMEKVKEFDAHQDYIRSLAIHPSLPYVLSSSDDMTIKLWDWDRKWQCVQVFEGHSHYVMQVVFNPKDANTFASASLDKTIKVWSLGSTMANFTLEGHDRGVNCIEYYPGGDRPFLISGGDDHVVKVWDYQTKACVQVLEGHTQNVSSVCFHPELPLIISASEDGTVNLYHSTTFRLQSTLNYSLGRAWCLGYLKGSSILAIGHDEGCVAIRMGQEEPVASMDASGKIVWARNTEVQTANVKGAGDGVESAADGEKLNLGVRDLGSCEIYPQSMSHSPNGRFVTVCGDGEYIVYTALAWRNKAFGQALDFVWASDSNEYAIRESATRVKAMKNFADKWTIDLNFSAEGMHGGPMLAVRSSDFVCFFDWGSGKPVRRIDVEAKNLFWSPSGEYLAISTGSSFYVLRCNHDAVAAALASGVALTEDGIDDAFELLYEIGEGVITGLWVGDCFIYTNLAWRLQTCAGGEITTLFHLDKPLYLLGYVPGMNRLFALDREYGAVSYTLRLSMIEFKTLVVRGLMDEAKALLPSIAEDQRDQVAKFLESRGMPEEALEVAVDPDYRLDLCITLGDLARAREFAQLVSSPAKWCQLGELALQQGDFATAEEGFTKGGDLSGLMLLYSSLGDSRGMRLLADRAFSDAKYNVSFLASLLVGDKEGSLKTLQDAGRVPEAALFARSYAPSALPAIIGAWKEDLGKSNARASQALADPSVHPDLFEGLEDAMEAERGAANGADHEAAGIPDRVEVHHEAADLHSPITSPKSPVRPAASQPAAQAAPPPPPPPAVSHVAPTAAGLVAGAAAPGVAADVYEDEVDDDEDIDLGEELGDADEDLADGDGGDDSWGLEAGEERDD